MIIDITGTLLTPGNFGKDCKGNGKDALVECCCDGCNYYLCCMNENDAQQCTSCMQKECPRQTK